MYTELEESDADLGRHQKWLAAIRARDYFDAPGGHEAVRERTAVGRARRVHFRRPARTARGRGRHRLTHRNVRRDPIRVKDEDERRCARLSEFHSGVHKSLTSPVLPAYRAPHRRE
jgi:hypothetical protein